MKTIASRQNTLFKRVRAALREHDHEIVLEGRKHVSDALAAGWRPIVVIERGRDFTEELFDQLSDTKTPQDVIALFERPDASFAELLKRTDSIIVALDAVQDPGNVGTIVRLAAAFDCAGVALLPGCADAFSPKSIRASAGAALTVPIATASIQDLVDAKWPLYAADAAGEVMDVPAARAILVFGNEGAGVSEPLRAKAKAIGIRMSPRIESLNVAASAAILLSKSHESR